MKDLYTAIPRRYRPQRFEEVIGQEHITRTLRNAIILGKIHHAYLFAGTRGTGKTTVARIFAKCLNCDKGPAPTPCRECQPCERIAEGTFIDVIEMDAGSQTSIDDIRQIKESVLYPPSVGRYKIFIIDEAHMLSQSAFNALLKTLEEPPNYVVFILATTEPYKIPDTIMSRVLRFDFRKIPASVIVEMLKEVCLKEGIEAEGESLFIIASEADGSMRDALSLLETISIYGEGRVTCSGVLEALGEPKKEAIKEVARHVFGGDAKACLKSLERFANEGADMKRFAERFLDFVKDITFELTGVPTNDDVREFIKAGSFTIENALRIYSVFLDGLENISRSVSPNIGAKMLFLKLCFLEKIMPILEPEVRESKEAEPEQLFDPFAEEKTEKEMRKEEDKIIEELFPGSKKL